MKYLLKQAVLPFLYLFFMMMISMGIICIGDNLLWLKIILSILNLLLYAVIVCAVAYKEGQESMKVRYANDLERMVIIKTGENRKLKLQEEYKPYKGFLVGLIISAPLIILMIVHTILIFTSSGTFNTIGGIAGIIYFIIFSFSRLVTTAPITPYTYYYSLFSIPFFLLIYGVPYVLGANKIYMQREKINEQQRQLYGDKK